MENSLDELYKVYGSLMIEAEIINAKIQDVKRRIAEGLNKLNEQNIIEKEGSNGTKS